jgi:hypothetical protein
MKCPKCKQGAKFKSWPDKPREAVMVDCVVDLIAPRYQCTNAACCVELPSAASSTTEVTSPGSESEIETSAEDSDATRASFTFSALNSEVVQQFPDWVKVNFPFFVTHKNAVHSTLMNQLEYCMTSNQSLNDFSKELINSHETVLFEKEVRYYSYAAHLWKKSFKANIFTKKMEGLPVPTRMKSERATKAVLSVDYLLSVWYDYFSSYCVLLDLDGEVITKEQYIHRRMQLNTGRIWKVDGSHKVQ